ncbi:hypothetical protein SELSPUOL_00744 [Selenomonas sputigena ATCC 35185]|uniref:Uncharacterized protein n=1 Tax=Selenomonas sputigena (strain ATCC 35185 / DSM 20758 / CCUG 44933 / VPI D19B-28) TaxID=546271 RepID=C9LTG1_SELS3|nr:hypothetical protein SELSPUOL_00744 [Selenomonas sputigena ATCC 35185]
MRRAKHCGRPRDLMREAAAGNDRACVRHLHGQDPGDRQTAQSALKKTWGTQMMQSKITQIFLM